MQRRFLVSAAVATLTVALCVFACSGQGEGQRCDTLDDPGGPDNSPGSSDCASNLKCYKASDLGATASTYNGTISQIAPGFGICCPLDRLHNATTSICAIALTPAGTDAAAPTTDAATDSGSPPDSGSPDSGSPDSASRDSASTDSASADSASTDSASDAPADAPDGG